MSVKSYIAPRVINHILGETRHNKKRDRIERSRIANGAPHKVEFFHDPSDPYSQLLDKVLPQFASAFQIELITHLVSPPNDLAAPERDKLAAYAKMDAMRLAKRAGIDFEVQDKAPAQHTGIADIRRQRLGHYSGGMLYYGEEWYWGLDRLHYLETRLSQLGARKAPLKHIYSPPVKHNAPIKLLSEDDEAVSLHWYLSFRSPYTAIVRDRVKALADAYGAQLKLHIVLPMVMRELPVPPAKRKYILFDTAREARRLGVDFGRIIDPVGKPVEMGYSLMAYARSRGLDYAYAQSWLNAVWAEGVDAGRPKALRMIAERAGLNWSEAKDVLGNPAWRDEAEANRLDMMERGIWGVPSFRVNERIVWGQDRLWVVENALQKIAERKLIAENGGA